VRLSGRSSLGAVASCVAAAMARAGIKAVLTGGACASLYSRGAYQSSDLDFVLQSAVSRRSLDGVMQSIGFHREGGHYRHPTAPFFVEFPAGPLGIGSDLSIEPVTYRVGRVSVLALSPTDSCRDRLAAFYHWNDLQSLMTAVAIAKRRRVDMTAIREWSDGEGATVAFERFRSLLRGPRNLKRQPWHARGRRPGRTRGRG
jgi:hypothetical protein